MEHMKITLKKTTGPCLRCKRNVNDICWVPAYAHMHDACLNTLSPHAHPLVWGQETELVGVVLSLPPFRLH